MMGWGWVALTSNKNCFVLINQLDINIDLVLKMNEFLL